MLWLSGTLIVEGMIAQVINALEFAAGDESRNMFIENASITADVIAGAGLIMAKHARDEAPQELGIMEHDN